MAETATTRFPRNHYQILDGLRGVAALCVLVMHLSLWFSPAKILGGAGLAVDFFFCLSGFVIAHAYVGKLEQGLPLESFIQLRLRRLYPLMIAGYALGAVYALGGALHAEPGGTSANVLDIANAFLMSAALAPHENPRIAPNVFPLDGATWSLFFEIWVNIAFAVVVATLGWRRARWLFLAAIVGGAAVCAHYRTGLQGFTLATFHLGIARVCVSFFIGVLAQRAFDRGLGKVLPAMGEGLFLVLAAVLLACFAVQSARPSIAFEMLAIGLVFPAVVLVGAAARPRRLEPAMKALGALSYPLYILHGPVAYLIVAAGKRSPVFHGASDPALIATAGAGAVAVSWIMLKAYDEPLRAYLASRARKRPAIA